jgi:type II restriction enzyme
VGITFILYGEKIMGLNLDKSNKWKSDIKKSVDMYNNWFLNFATEAFRIMRKKTILEVADALSKTDLF